MAKNTVSVTPARKRGLIKTIWDAVGEMSVIRTSRQVTIDGFSGYTLDSSRVDYDLARELYRNNNEKYKLGAGFAKPIVNSTSGFIGMPSFTHANSEGDQALERALSGWTGKLFRVNRNTLRDGDIYVRFITREDRFSLDKELVIDIQLLPPEWVSTIVDPLIGGYMEVKIRYPFSKKDNFGRVELYAVIETITNDQIIIEVEDKAPDSVKALAGSKPNPWGFIPIVGFKNEAEEFQTNGISDLEPVEPFMKAYHDTMLFAVEGSKMFSRPKTSFSVNNVADFLERNFTAAEIASGKLQFANKEVFLMEQGEAAGFITADSGLSGITGLLKFLYYCIVDVSETPEFCFGTAVQSSKASVSEQMVPFARKIRRKRGMLEEYYGELASMYLAIWSKINNVKLDTYKADIGWEEISPRNDKEVADTIKTLAEGLTASAESGLVSLSAASEFMREFVPSMLPYLDPDADDDERRRIAKGLAFLWRAKDGQGYPPEGDTGDVENKVVEGDKTVEGDG